MESTLPDSYVYFSLREAWLWVRRVTASSNLSVVVLLVVWSAMAMAAAGRTSVRDAGGGEGDREEDE